jgi:hypothetical protein
MYLLAVLCREMFTVFIREENLVKEPSCYLLNMWYWDVYLDVYVGERKLRQL